MEFTEKQIRIIEVAERLFAERGFNGTSVRDIATEADINLAMISYYFGSKEKLLEAIFHYRFDDSQRYIGQILNNSSLGPMEKVESMVISFLDNFIRRHNFHKIIQREQLLDSEDSIRRQIIEFKKTSGSFCGRILREGQEKGVFKEDLDPGFFIAVMVGASYHTLNSKHLFQAMGNLPQMEEPELDEYIKNNLKSRLISLFHLMLLK